MGRQLEHEALVPAVRRAASKADPAINPYRIEVVLPLEDPHAPPMRRPPSSRTIARLREKAKATAREAAAARALQAQVQPGFKPPSGKLFATDVAGLVLRGPAGGIGSSSRIVRTLETLAAGGRHAAAVLVAAGEWQDEEALHEALTGLAPKLSAIGLRVCRRKAGLRMAKARPMSIRAQAQ